MKLRPFVAMAAVVGFTATTYGGYTITPLSGGGRNRAVVNWGDNLTLDFVFNSDASDVHDSAIFQAIFTEPGLRYDAYSWTTPYTNGLPLDDSTPDLSSLPLLLDDTVLTGTGHPTGVVDLEMSNVLIGSTFAEGTVVTLDFTVPLDFGFLGSVFIAATPDTVAHGFDEVPTSGGTVFELLVIPEPSTCTFMLLLMTAALRRGRRG